MERAKENPEASRRRGLCSEEFLHSEIDHRAVVIDRAVIESSCIITLIPGVVAGGVAGGDVPVVTRWEIAADVTTASAVSVSGEAIAMDDIGGAAVASVIAAVGVIVAVVSIAVPAIVRVGVSVPPVMGIGITIPVVVRVGAAACAMSVSSVGAVIGITAVAIVVCVGSGSGSSEENRREGEQ